MRIAVKRTLEAALCVLLAAGTAWAGDGHTPKPQSSSATAETQKPGPAGQSALRQEVERLREILALQAQTIQEQSATLKAQQQQLNALARQLSLGAEGHAPLGPPSAPVTASVQSVPSAAAEPPNEKPSEAEVIPAIAPIRALPVGGLPREGPKAPINVGSVGITPYGFLKATFVQDSSSPNGDDFPLPGFLGDSGPTASPAFHIKARASRFGANFKWTDRSPKLTLTGKIEFDFEGNFSRADNRNLSSIRSSMPSLRLAYARLDYKATAHNTFSALLGQDWTPFGSSTLPPILETTGLGIGFGGLWERDPQMRFGWTHDFGKFQIMPEFAVVLPASGDTPSALNIVDQLGYGERQGPDSDRPDLQARLVFQWQLDRAPGVVPAQIIFSAEQGRRDAIVLASAVPAQYAAAFSRGATVSSNSDGWTAEWQLPTRFATLIGKYYDGSDLRWFFGGQLFSNYNDTLGLTGIATASSIDGASTVAFGMLNGVPVVAPQRPIRAAGGFVSLDLPLSRIAGADPEGRNRGWSLDFTYGTDQAKTRDLLRLEPNGSRGRSDMSVGTVYYGLNRWVTFAFEQSLYRTRANTAAAGLPLFMGLPQHEWKDVRSEGGTIFSF